VLKLAFIVFVVAGFAGVVAMLTSIFAFETSFLAALAVWFGTGMALSVAGIAVAMAPRRQIPAGRLVEA
jgi:uncharacterized membrane protein YccC